MKRTAAISSLAGVMLVFISAGAIAQIAQERLANQAAVLKKAHQVFYENIDTDRDYSTWTACEDAHMELRQSTGIDSRLCGRELDAVLAADKALMAADELPKRAPSADFIAIQALIQRAANGDRTTGEECSFKLSSPGGHKVQRSLGARDQCRTQVGEAFGQGLRKKAFQPVSCYEWGQFHGNVNDLSNPMAVSLDTSKVLGPFRGQVLRIDGRELLIYNPNTGANALVNALKAKVYEAGGIMVGAEVVGYGVQTGSFQGRRVSGAPTTIARITAQCVGG